jgi:hypothetical protein
MKLNYLSGLPDLTKKASQRLVKEPNQKRRQIKNNEAEIVYLDAITTIGNMVVEARKNKDTEGLKQMAIAISQIAFYVNELQLERENLYLQL